MQNADRRPDTCWKHPSRAAWRCTACLKQLCMKCAASGEHGAVVCTQCGGEAELLLREVEPKPMHAMFPEFIAAFFRPSSLMAVAAVGAVAALVASSALLLGPLLGMVSGVAAMGILYAYFFASVRWAMLGQLGPAPLDVGELLSTAPSALGRLTAYGLVWLVVGLGAFFVAGALGPAVLALVVLALQIAYYVLWPAQTIVMASAPSWVDGANPMRGVAVASASPAGYVVLLVALFILVVPSFFVVGGLTADIALTTASQASQLGLPEDAAEMDPDELAVAMQELAAERERESPEAAAEREQQVRAASEGALKRMVGWMLALLGLGVVQSALFAQCMGWFIYSNARELGVGVEWPVEPVFPRARPKGKWVEPSSERPSEGGAADASHDGSEDGGLGAFGGSWSWEKKPEGAQSAKLPPSSASRPPASSPNPRAAAPPPLVSASGGLDSDGYLNPRAAVVAPAGAPIESVQGPLGGSLSLPTADRPPPAPGELPSTGDFTGLGDSISMPSQPASAAAAASAPTGEPVPTLGPFAAPMPEEGFAGGAAPLDSTEPRALSSEPSLPSYPSFGGELPPLLSTDEHPLSPESMPLLAAQDPGVGLDEGAGDAADPSTWLSPPGQTSPLLAAPGVPTEPLSQPSEPAADPSTWLNPPGDTSPLLAAAGAVTTGSAAGAEVQAPAWTGTEIEDTETVPSLADADLLPDWLASGDGAEPPTEPTDRERQAPSSPPNPAGEQARGTSAADAPDSPLFAPAPADEPAPTATRQLMKGFTGDDLATGKVPIVTRTRSGSGGFTDDPERG